MGYNPICEQAHKDLNNIMESWNNGGHCTTDEAVMYLLNRAICKDVEMGKYWKEHNEMYHGAVYPKDNSYDMEWKEQNHNAYEMTYEQGKEWVSKMENSDGTAGEHWSMPTTTAVAKQYGIDLMTISPECFYISMNKKYSDGYETAKIYGLQDDVSYYVNRVKEDINDMDTVSLEERLAVEYNLIRKH